MRCKDCPHTTYDYSEGHETCNLFGDNEDFVYENNHGSVGCRFNRKQLKKYEKEHEFEEAEICRQMGDFVKWYNETYGKENV